MTILAANLDARPARGRAGERPAAGHGARRARARPRRSRRWLGAGAAVLLVAVMAALVATRSDDGRADRAQAADRKALLAYTGKVEPLAHEGGEVVQLGLKAGVNDIGQSRFSDQELVGMAQGWVDELERVRDGFARLEPPAFLDDAQWLYEQALEGYVATAKVLLAAAQAQGQLRADLVGIAVSMGERTDDTYERARGIVNRNRTRLGLTPDTLPSD